MSIFFSPSGLGLAIVIGFAFGFLLQRGRVTSCDVIENQFRLKDFTVLKVILTAILVGGIGVMVLVDGGLAKYAPKDTNLLGVGLGAALFGVGMVFYGYCPGTGLAAIATGSVHALVGAVGMLVGGILFALSFDWIKANVLTVGAYGKIRLPDVTGIPAPAWFLILAICSIGFFIWAEKHDTR
jgi:uncharacterized membrane protein YedE/YeeE